MTLLAGDQMSRWERFGIPATIAAVLAALAAE
jgi:hypothetical protein